MKYKLDIQHFGGRGSRSLTLPKRKTGGKNSVLFVNETLKDALGKKYAPFSMNEALEDVNKERWSSNYAVWAVNCQRCVVAYELERRGYDVVALPNSGDKWDEALIKNGDYYGRWRGAFRKAKNVNVGTNSVKNTVSKIEKQMKQYGNGARAVIQYHRTRGGHVFNVENDRGNIIFVDAQSGRRYSSGYEALKSSVPQTVRLVRTDNLRISDRAKYFVTQSKNFNKAKKRAS